MIEQEAKTCLMYQKLKHFVNLFLTMEMTHVVTFTEDKILDKADLAQSFCHKFVQICLQNEKWKILLSNPDYVSCFKRHVSHMSSDKKAQACWASFLYCILYVFCIVSCMDPCHLKLQKWDLYS